MEQTELILSELLENELKVLEISCEQAIFYGNSILYVSDILPKLKSISIRENEVLDCLDSLYSCGYIDKKLSLINEKEYLFVFSINHFAIEQYLRKHLRNYDSLHNRIVSYINSNEAKDLTSENISEKLNLPKLIVNHFLEKMQMMGHLNITKRIRGNWLVNKNIKPFVRISKYL